MITTGNKGAFVTTVKAIQMKDGQIVVASGLAKQTADGRQGAMLTLSSEDLRQMADIADSQDGRLSLIAYQRSARPVTASPDVG